MASKHPWTAPSTFLHSTTPCSFTSTVKVTHSCDFCTVLESFGVVVKSSTFSFNDSKVAAAAARRRHGSSGFDSSGNVLKAPSEDHEEFLLHREYYQQSPVHVTAMAEVQEIIQSVEATEETVRPFTVGDSKGAAVARRYMLKLSEMKKELEEREKSKDHPILVGLLTYTKVTEGYYEQDPDREDIRVLPPPSRRSGIFCMNSKAERTAKSIVKGEKRWIPQKKEARVHLKLCFAKKK